MGKICETKIEEKSQKEENLNSFQSHHRPLASDKSVDTWVLDHMNEPNLSNKLTSDIVICISLILKHTFPSHHRPLTADKSVDTWVSENYNMNEPNFSNKPT